MPPKCKFQEGEKVLCFHGPLIYEAKCLKSSVTKDKQIKYFIHYAGWNKNWDEWVPESRVLKYSDANVQKQREVQRTHNQQSSNKNKKAATSAKSQTRKSEGGREKDSDSRASTPVSALEKSTGRTSKYSSNALTPTQEQPTEPPRKKRGRMEPSNESDDFQTKVEIKIVIPDELKSILIDENELINKQRKLPALPMRINVDKILDDYIESKKSADSTESDNESTSEVTKGIKEYFNLTLGLQLLYKWERPQFDDIMSERDALPSEIYGAFHLLRLFVKLGGMLSYTTLDERSIQLLLKHFHEFLEYLQKHSVTLFDLQQDYVVSTPDYHRKYIQL